MTVQWTEEAYQRLAEIEDFIARDNPAIALRTVEQIIARAETLEQFSARGRIVPEIGNPDIREVFEGNYRIVYRLKGQLIQVLTVFESHLRPPADDIR